MKKGQAKGIRIFWNDKCLPSNLLSCQTKVSLGDKQCEDRRLQGLKKWHYMTFISKTLVSRYLSTEHWHKEASNTGHVLLSPIMSPNLILSSSD